MNDWLQFTCLTSIDDDITAAVTRDCVCEVTQWGALYVSGADTLKFLQGQLSCNMQLISATQSQLGAYCNAHGRVIALFMVLQWQDGVLLLMPREIIVSTMEILGKYAIFSKVSMVNYSEVIQLQGFVVKNKSSQQLPVADYAVITYESQVSVIKLPGNRYLSVSEHGVLPVLARLFLTEVAVGSVAWHYLQLQQGCPNIYAATQQKLLPHRINLHLLQAINFNKGCYVGQEIIARTHFKATLKHTMLLYRLSRAYPLYAGDIIHTADNLLKIGEVIDSCPAPHEQQLVLATMLLEWQQLDKITVQNQLLHIRLGTDT